MTMTNMIIAFLVALYVSGNFRSSNAPRMSRAERRALREWHNWGQYAEESRLRWQAHQAGLKYRPPPRPPLSDRRFCAMVIVANVIALLTWTLFFT
jgi:hypothetical protein